MSVRAKRGALCLTVLALLLAACGGEDADDGDPTTEEPEAPAPEEPSDGEDAEEGDAEEGEAASGGDFEAPDELLVGHISAVGSHMAAVRAMDEGYFVDEGFEGTEFTLVGFPGGAAIVPAMVSGEVDFGVSNWVSVVAALSQGIDLTILGENERNNPGNQQVLTMSDSDISSPSDLEGRTVGINTLNGISHLGVLMAVAEDGGDTSAVEFREVPFPEMAALLERGDVDAVQSPSVFNIFIPDQVDAVTAFDLNDIEAFEGIPIGGYIANADLAEESPEMLLAVEAALQRGRDDLQDREVKMSLLQREEVSSMDPELAEQAVEFAPETVESDWSEVQRIADAMLEFGFIENPVTISDHVLNGS
jgi:NitT/TauT family transport system substrate-binding protein